MASPTNEFAPTLCRLRKAAGYASTWAFYKAHGPRFFGCTYRAYYYVETGHSLPQPRLALRIAQALKILGERERTREFVASYVASLLGRGELADFLVRSVSGEKIPRGYAALFQKASKLIFSGKQVPLTRRQADVLAANAENYWCWTVLSNDFGRWSVQELATGLGASLPRARAALRALVAERLLSKDEQERYFCPQAGQLFVFPRGDFYLPSYRAAIKRIWDEMAERKGAAILDRHILLRASEADMRSYFPHLAQTVKGAHVHAVWEKGPDTAYVATRAAIRKIMPF